MKSKKLAALMALVMGSFGVHKFYLGEGQAGFFYIVLNIIGFNIFGLPIAIMLAVFDAIKLFTMSDSDFDHKYNSKYLNKNRRQSTSRGTVSNNRNTRDRDHNRNRYNTPTNKNIKNPFKTSAKKKYEDYDLEAAIEEYNKAIGISPNDPQLHFEVASVYSLLENKSKSLFHLDQAFGLGYDKVETLQTTDDLAFLRIQHEYEAFVENGYRLDKVSLPNNPNKEIDKEDKLLAQLNKLQELRTKGLLSDNEYIYEKEKLMRR